MKDRSRGFLAYTSGVLFSQVVMFLSIPFLSGRYDPEEYGMYGAILFFTSLFSIVGSLKYEQAIVLIEEDGLSNLVTGCYVILIIMTVIGYFISNLYLSYTSLASLTGRESRLVSVSILLLILLVGSSTILTLLFVKYVKYSVIAAALALQAIAQVALQLLLSSSGVLGLLAGGVAGWGVSNLCFVAYIIYNRAHIAQRKDRPSPAGIGRELLNYKDFPIFNAPQAVVNIVNRNFPIILFSFLGLNAFVGLYVMAAALVQKPVDVIVKPANNVLLKEFSLASSIEKRKELIALMWKFTLIFIGVSIIGLMILVLFGSEMISFLLDKRWHNVLDLIVPIALWISFGLISIPSQVALRVVRRQEILLRNSIIFLLFRSALILLIALNIMQSVPVRTMWLLCAVGCLQHITIIIKTSRTLDQNNEQT